MQDLGKPIANPLLVLREEFDDWAILFDPDTGDASALNPVSVFIFKKLDGNHTVADIISALQKECTDMPGNAEQEVQEFISGLVGKGYAGYEVSK